MPLSARISGSRACSAKTLLQRSTTTTAVAAGSRCGTTSGSPRQMGFGIAFDSPTTSSSTGGGSEADSQGRCGDRGRVVAEDGARHRHKGGLRTCRPSRTARSRKSRRTLDHRCATRRRGTLEPELRNVGRKVGEVQSKRRIVPSASFRSSVAVMSDIGEASVAFCLSVGGQWQTFVSQPEPVADGVWGRNVFRCK